MRRLKFNLALFVAVSLLLSFSAYSATIEVSHPVQLTNSEYYERGQSIVFDGTYYWLFFGRSTGCTDPYSTGDPDVHDYEIYYKRAASVSGLAAAAAVKVTGTHNTTATGRASTTMVPRGVPNTLSLQTQVPQSSSLRVRASISSVQTAGTRTSTSGTGAAGR